MARGSIQKNKVASFASNADLKVHAFILDLKYLVLLKEALLYRKYIHHLFCNWKDDQCDTYYNQVFLNYGH